MYSSLHAFLLYYKLAIILLVTIIFIVTVNIKGLTQQPPENILLFDL